jgi:DNA-directed RNA polymerase specialized sigma24 family protein
MIVEQTIKEQTIKEKFYVNSKLFREQLTTYYNDDNMTNDLAQNIVKIAEGLSYNWRFLNYTKSWKEDMVGDAIVKMYAALESKKFRLDSEFNPFSYFNQIAWNAFSNRIKKEKKQHDGLEVYKQIMYEEAMHDPSSQGHVYVKPMMDSDENDGDYE